MPLYSPMNNFVENLRKLFKNRVKDGRLAFLGDGTGRVEVPDRKGYVYYRFQIGDSPGIARSGNASFPVYEGAEVYIAIGYNGEPEIVGANYQRLDEAGFDTRTFNQMHQASHWVNLWQLTIGLCTAVATSTTNSFLVSIKKHLTYFNNVLTYFETGEEANKIDLEPYNPAADQHCYVVVWKDAYSNVAEVTASTAQSLFMPLSIEDVNEAVAQRPPDAQPFKAFVLANNGNTLRQSITEVDLRQFLNVPQVHGFPSPVTHRERIHPDRQQLFVGSLVVTGSLEVLGSLVGLPTGGDAGSGSGSGAPADATYLVQVADSDLPNAQAMGALATGLVKNTTTTGVQSIAVADTDYTTPTGLAAAIALLTAKRMVRLATAAALPTNTYANGSSGVGATLTATANGALTVDGTAVSAGDRILVKDESSALKNGIYTVTQAGSGGTPYILTRTTDADTSDELRGCMVMPVAGSTNAQQLFQNTNTSAITLGTTGITFTNTLGNFANRTLSNLSNPTAVSQNLIPFGGSRTLGDDVSPWVNFFGVQATFLNNQLDTVPTDWVGMVARSIDGTVGALFSVDDNGNELQLSPHTAIITYSVSSATSGGTTTTTTWVTRPLNTEAADLFSLVTLSSNRFTPITGQYRATIFATVVAAAASATIAVHRLFNHTTTTEVAKSPTVRMVADTGDAMAFQTMFTANGTDEYRIDTYVSAGRATTGLGFQASTGTNEVYTIVVLEKIG